MDNTIEPMNAESATLNLHASNSRDDTVEPMNAKSATVNLGNSRATDPTTFTKVPEFSQLPISLDIMGLLDLGEVLMVSNANQNLLIPDSFWEDEVINFSPMMLQQIGNDLDW